MLGFITCAEARRVEQIAVNQLVVGDIRCCGRRSDQTDGVPHDSADYSGEKRVVRAPQNQGIDPFFFQGRKVLAGDPFQFGTSRLPGLDVLDEKWAGLLEDSKTWNCSKSIDISF